VQQARDVSGKASHRLVPCHALQEGRALPRHDPIVNASGVPGDSLPRIHPLDAQMELVGVNRVSDPSFDRPGQAVHEARHRWLREVDHIIWQDLWDPPHVGRHHEQTAGRRLQEGDTERFGERTVEEDMSPDQHLSNLRVGDGPAERDPVLQPFSLHHFLQIKPLGAVPSNDEVHAGKCRAYPRDDAHEQVHPLPVYQAGHHHYDDPAIRGTLRNVRGELGRIDRVWDDVDDRRVHSRPNDEVVPAGVADADGGIDRRQGDLEDAVEDERRDVVEAEEGVIRIDRAQAKLGSVDEGFVGQRRSGLMGVDDAYPLADKYVPEEGKRGREGGEAVLVGHGEERAVVHLQRPGEVSDAGPPGRAVRAGIGVSDHNDLVPALDEVLGEGIDVILDASQPRVEEVAHEGHAVAPVSVAISVAGQGMGMGSWRHCLQREGAQHHRCAGSGACVIVQEM